MIEKQYDSIFLQVLYNKQSQGLLIEQINNLGLGQDMRLQASEIMFKDNPENPDMGQFTLVVDSARRDEITNAFKLYAPDFKVSFVNPPEIELSAMARDAARERLKSKGFHIS